jgi:hypothetical protein
LAAAFSGKYKLINSPAHLLQAGVTGQLQFQDGAGITNRGLGLVIDGQHRFQTHTTSPVNLHYGLSMNQSVAANGEETRTTAGYVLLAGVFENQLRWSSRLDASRSAGAVASQTNLSLTLGLSGQLGNGLGYGVSFTQGRVNAANANAASGEQRIKIHVTPNLEALPVSISMFGEYGVRTFDHETPFFGGIRRDEDINFGVTLAPNDYTVMGMVPSITIRQSHRNSNIDINDAVSQDFFVGLRSSF